PVAPCLNPQSEIGKPGLADASSQLGDLIAEKRGLLVFQLPGGPLHFRLQLLDELQDLLPLQRATRAVFAGRLGHSLAQVRRDVADGLNDALRRDAVLLVVANLCLTA